MRDVRRYRFETTWLLDAPVEACWAVLADPALSWPSWWPGLAGDVVELGPAARDHVGSRARLRYRSPFGFTLRIELALVAARPPVAATFAVRGDLVGRGTVDLAPADARPGGRCDKDPGPVGTRVVVGWDVATTRGWMNALGPVASPAFAWSHAHVMRRGGAGLAVRLRSRPDAGQPCSS